VILELFRGELPRLVMFDLDGTLVDSVPDLAAAVDRMLAQLGREPAGVEHGAVSDADTERALELFSEAYAGSHALSRVYPGVVSTLDWLRGAAVELALITNKPERFVAPLLDEMGLGGYFRWIIGGDTLPQQKPDPAALLHVLRLAGVAPEQALFVGDSRNDVLAAHAAGVPCVALSYGYNHGRPIAEENPARVLDDLRQLLPGCAQEGAGVMSPNPSEYPPHETASW
jgi:phosphoglycolate phosphatase